MLKPVVPPTEKAKYYRTVLLVLGVINMILAFMEMFNNIFNGFYAMIIASILFCSIASVNYCCLTLYMVYITLDWLNNLCTVGLLIQTGTFITVLTSHNSQVVFALVLTWLFLIYETIAWFICFYAFKEFKAMLFE